MQNTNTKSACTAKQSINPSSRTIFHMVLAGVGFTGMLVFGFLMDVTLAPIRETSGAPADNGFNSFGDGVIIPGFLLSLYLCAYGAYELYKVYRRLNDPNSYGNKSRRIRVSS